MGALMTPKAKILLVLALSIAPAAAHAAASAGVDHGTIMIGAERLFGLSLSRETTATNNGDNSTDNTTFTLLYSASPNVHMTPRLTCDFVPIDGLTIGGGIGFGVGSLDDSRTRNSATTNTDGPTSTWIIISPRVGYVLGLSSLAKLWLRGGLTYFWMNTDFPSAIPNTSVSSRLTGLSLDLEPTLLLQPFTHLGFTASLLVNLPLTGSFTTDTTVGGTTTSTSVDRTIRNFGLAVGMVGRF
jgi:hypothetical protein